ncbi:MAG: MgtC/SapB family protein [Novosphingobium sp.]|nr:MgtC/SapB family protein [Novosphingobium sp.]
MIELCLINTLLFSKIILASIIGWLIGYERKKRDKIGGSRTFALVSLASVLMATITLKFVGIYTFDFFRLMSYGIAGIGFLGSGFIIKEKHNVEGLTGASCLFALVPISFLIGLEQYFLGISSAILMYYILELKHKNGD